MKYRNTDIQKSDFCIFLFFVQKNKRISLIKPKLRLDK